VEFAIKEVCGAIDKLRQMSPLWEMAQEGIDITSIDWAHH
jgi:cysteine desulfurase